MVVKNLFVIFLSVFLFVSLVGAVELNNITDCSSLEAQKSEIIGMELPDKAPFRDEILNVYLEEDIFGNLQIENKTIKDFECLEHEDATYKIYINNSEVINDFIDSEDFIGTYENKTDSGEIKIKGIGLGKKIKLGFIKLFLKFV